MDAVRCAGCGLGAVLISVTWTIAMEARVVSLASAESIGSTAYLNASVNSITQVFPVVLLVSGVGAIAFAVAGVLANMSVVRLGHEHVLLRAVQRPPEGQDGPGWTGR